METDDTSRTADSASFIAPASVAGQRLDAVAASLFGDYSRSRLQLWIKSGFLRVDGQLRKTRDKLVGGEQITLSLPPDATGESWQDTWDNGAANIVAEALDIAIVHTDPHFHVINKAAACVMHPAPGNRTGTLMNGLLYHEPALRQVPRAGIVHRLDKDTTGLCVVARTLKAHTSFVNQLQSRTVSRQYLALVLGNDVPESGTIDEPVGRHPKDRKRMAVTRGGKHSITHFHVLERFEGCALVSVKLETGRTHQIRVHMQHLGFPLLGDPVYKRGNAVSSFNRQALHAWQLGLVHPETGAACHWQVEPPEDFQTVLVQLRKSTADKA